MLGACYGEEGVIRFVEGPMHTVEGDLFACTAAIRSSRRNCKPAFFPCLETILVGGIEDRWRTWPGSFLDFLELELLHRQLCERT